MYTCIQGDEDTEEEGHVSSANFNVYRISIVILLSSVFACMLMISDKTNRLALLEAARCQAPHHPCQAEGVR